MWRHFAKFSMPCLTRMISSSGCFLNAEFHATIARCSGNGVFAGVLTDIREAMADQSNTLNLVADRRKESDASMPAFSMPSSGDPPRKRPGQ